MERLKAAKSKWLARNDSYARIVTSASEEKAPTKLPIEGVDAQLWLPP